MDRGAIDDKGDEDMAPYIMEISWGWYTWKGRDDTGSICGMLSIIEMAKVLQVNRHK